jgi:phosphoribosylaminoimidazolecarboxamide formyltransferase/IMP cyclohydrolase
VQKIRRAIVSTSDKTGIVEFAKGLAAFGVEMLSTGGTARALAAAGVPVRPVADYTGWPEMLDGRVRTLHPMIHGGLLGLRDNPDHARQMQDHGIQPIDMVVVNLYPFEQTVANPGVTLEDAIENIDIGGPSMLRSAAKNYRSVAVICNPARYEAVLAEMRDHDGALTDETRASLALEAFRHTAHYDAAISEFLAARFGAD